MFGQDRSKTLKIVASSLAAAGAVLMGYLTRLHYSPSGFSAVCDFSAGFSCDIVNKSLYSEILGVPVAVLGLVYFLAVPYLLYAKPLKEPWRAIVLFTVFSLVFGLYLTLLEQFVIDSICLFCEASKLLMIGILVVAARGVRLEREKLPASWIGVTIVFGILFSWAAYGLASA